MHGKYFIVTASMGTEVTSSTTTTSSNNDSSDVSDSTTTSAAHHIKLKSYCRSTSTSETVVLDAAGIAAAVKAASVSQTHIPAEVLALPGVADAASASEPDDAEGAPAAANIKVLLAACVDHLLATKGGDMAKDARSGVLAAAEVAKQHVCLCSQGALQSSTLSHSGHDGCVAQGNEAYLAKQLEEALKHYSDAIKLVPENLVYRLNRAATLVELERFDQAVSECKRVISSGKRGRWCLASAKM